MCYLPSLDAVIHVLPQYNFSTFVPKKAMVVMVTAVEYTKS